MNQKELLILSIAAFLTIIAWMIIDIYHLQNRHIIDTEITAVGSMKFEINDSIFKTLRERK